MKPYVECEAARRLVPEPEEPVAALPVATLRPFPVPLSKGGVRGAIAILGLTWKAYQTDDDDDKKLLTNILQIEDGAAAAGRAIRWIRDANDPTALERLQTMREERLVAEAEAGVRAKKGKSKTGNGKKPAAKKTAKDAPPDAGSSPPPTATE